MTGKSYNTASPMQDEADLKIAIPRAKLVEILLERYDRLPEIDRKFFAYGPVYLGINGAFAGLIANSFFRRLLNVTQGLFTSSLPMAFLPFMTTIAVYNGFVSKPLLSGDLNCPTCAMVRGGLVGSVAGGLYPILLALPINGGLAARYNTAPMPEKGNILRFWIRVSQPILKKMSFVLLLQALFGVYLSSRNYGIYIKMLQLPHPNIDAEELKG
ncbi:transmembrane protein 126A [Latimeria chalumnae]|uniref:Transmembrane protein 126A n=1 Tax=Latimeria chalumnae TaxID=7897 RepID=H3B9Z8_LATCH|nr:PREDICTED: transmembrane protein 126A isoform X2 [Latimeria chalumnae]|eukprot:XP_005995234.1 PREDICTED: transmembrane protein 126A isoform X2 [Latimeria chalumnae]